MAFRTNRDSVSSLAQFANAQGIPLIHLSTDYVFDGGKPKPYLESDAVSPAGIYGLSKLGGELAARQAEQHVVLRVSWVFAAHGANFVRTMLRLGADRDVLRVVDDQRGGPTWAGDIANALRTLVDRVRSGDRLPSGTWHFAGEPHLSWYEFAREILTEAARRKLIPKLPTLEAIATHEYPTPARRPANSRMDSSLALKELKLEVPDWRRGLSECLDEIAAAR